MPNGADGLSLPGGSAACAMADIARVLVVDDELIVREILVRKMNQLGYDAQGAGGGEAALKALQKRPYDLLLMDLAVPGNGGLSFMKEARRLCPDIAVIVVTSVVDIGTAVKALKDGASDYVTKPFSLEEVAISVARALEKRRLLIENRRYQRTLEEQVASRTAQLKDALEELQRTYHSTLLALGTALDSRDADADWHSLRVTLYSVRLGTQLALGPGELQSIEQAALLHDIGKIGIPDALLRKPAALTDADWVLMRKHPEIGHRILSGIRFLQRAAQVVLQHHERFDGTGYPTGIKGDQIILEARILALADTLDCMTSARPFQPAASFEAAREQIRKLSGTQLDPAVVAAFLEIAIDEWKGIRQRVNTGVRGARAGSRRPALQFPATPNTAYPETDQPRQTCAVPG